jgi:4'-phosphopantetheinyl transferase
MRQEPPRLAAQELLEIRAEEAHVWSASLDLDETTIRPLERLLSLDERERAGRFLFARHRRRFVVGRGVLRTILSRYTATDPGEIAISYDMHGKPFLSSPCGPSEIAFNVSHAGDIALIAVARGRGIGIDIEQIRKHARYAEVARRFFSPHEQNVLDSTPETEREKMFVVLWTRKEACVKASGLGLLAFALPSFDVSSHAKEPRVIVSGGKDTHSWTVVDVETVSGYAAACAVDGVGLRIVRKEFRL